jgi:hypothetical protein
MKQKRRESKQFQFAASGTVFDSKLAQLSFIGVLLSLSGLVKISSKKWHGFPLKKTRKSIMDEVDKKNRLDEEVFSYRVTKDRRVFLFWHGKHVKTLKGSAAQKFLQDIVNVDEEGMQLVMAKVTGNFKRGNER